MIFNELNLPSNVRSRHINNWTWTYDTMKKHLLFIALFFLYRNISSGQGTDFEKCKNPFPHHTDGVAARLGSMAVDDATVKSYYDPFKIRYFRNDGRGGCYVLNDEEGDQKENLTTSEANGYGMIIEALMAGHDPQAHARFDSLYRFAIRHHAKKTNLLMRWRVPFQSESADERESDTAIDGDLDMAYALFLAAEQWGKTEAFDYRDLAQRTLNEILRLEVDVQGVKLLRGDAANNGKNDWSYNAIRLSDYMPDHFRAFARLTGNKFWLQLIARYEKLFTNIQQHESRPYGLFPDYVIVNNDQYKLALDVKVHKLKKEGMTDGGERNLHGNNYGTNSCRVPWRIATDYLLNADSDKWPAITLQALSTGVRRYTISNSCLLPDMLVLNDDPDSKGHRDNLYRDTLKHSADLNIIGPIYLASLTDPGQKEWKSMLLKQLLNDRPMPCSNNNGSTDRNYYENTLRILFLLSLNNSYWSPTIKN